MTLSPRGPSGGSIKLSLHVENAKYTQNGHLPLAMRLLRLRRRSGHSLPEPEDEHSGPPGREGTWLLVPTLPLMLVFHPLYFNFPVMTGGLGVRNSNIHRRRQRTEHGAGAEGLSPVRGPSQAPQRPMWVDRGPTAASLPVSQEPRNADFL